MLLVLSPSKTLEEKPARMVGKPTPPALLEETKTLVALMKKKSVKDIAKLMGISEKLAKLNHERYQHFSFPLTPKNAAQCIFMFKGDVYEGLNAESLEDKKIEFAQKHVRILSGLYGLLRPLDLMHPYRLEMGIRLKNPRGSSLYDFWGDRVTALVNEELEGQTSKVLLNLASEEYAKAIQPAKIKGRVVQVTFKEKKGKEYKVIGIHAKRARGLMARYIVSHKLDNPEKIRDFSDEGYCFHSGLSAPDELVFAR